MLLLSLVHVSSGFWMLTTIMPPAVDVQHVQKQNLFIPAWLIQNFIFPSLFCLCLSLLIINIILIEFNWLLTHIRHHHRLCEKMWVEHAPGTTVGKHFCKPFQKLQKVYFLCRSFKLLSDAFVLDSGIFSHVIRTTCVCVDTHAMQHHQLRLGTD